MLRYGFRVRVESETRSASAPSFYGRGRVHPYFATVFINARKTGVFEFRPIRFLEMGENSSEVEKRKAEVVRVSGSYGNFRARASSADETHAYGIGSGFFPFGNGRGVYLEGHGLFLGT